MVELETKLKGIGKASTFDSIVKYLEKKPCSLCDGKKLNHELLEDRICGYSIGDVEQLPASDLKGWCDTVRKSFKETAYYEQVELLLADIERRAQHLIDLKLEYISVGRSIPTLSGGELQRVRLATQLDCSLSGLIYILDEPCKGLHYKNVNSIVKTTRNLVEKGNTVIAIEHNGKDYKPYLIMSKLTVLEFEKFNDEQVYIEHRSEENLWAADYILNDTNYRIVIDNDLAFGVVKVR